MTLQDFCLQYAYPITRTSRLVRKNVLRTARVKEGQPFQVTLESVGVRAWRDPGAQRISYDVFDPPRLRSALLHTVGRQNLLTEGNFDILIGAAIYERDAILEEQRRRGQLHWQEEERLRALERALASVGVDISWPQAPPLR